MSDISNYNEWIKRINRTQTSAVEGLNNSTYWYYQDKLLKMIYSIFTFNNLPETWDKSYLLANLYLYGLLMVVDTSIGVVPLISGYSGVNVYGYPTDFNINNVVLGNLQGKIGEDGLPIYFGMQGAINGLFSYSTMKPLLEHYATLLSECDGSLQTTLINSRVAQVFEASSNSQMKTMEKVYDKISTGKPAVFIRKNSEEPFEHAIFNNVKQTYIGNELITTKQSIINEFKSEIGFKAINGAKKERLVSGEAEYNSSERYGNIYYWKDTLQSCFDKINAKYGFNISVDYNDEVLSDGANDIIDVGGNDNV